MMSLWTTLVALLLASTVVVGAIEQRLDSGAIPALNALKKTYGLPALAAGQGQPKEAFAVEVVGVRKEGNPKPALTTDYYHLGSNTKAMVAALLAQLIQDGHFTWSTTLKEALPGFKLAPRNQAITIEMLTSHRSGLTDTILFNKTFFVALYKLDAITGRWSASNRTLSAPPPNAHGSYTYANINYMIVGMVIDVAIHTPAETLLQRRIFAPLGITSVGFGPCPETSNISIDNPWPHYQSPSGPIPYAAVPNADRDLPPAMNTAGRVHIIPSNYNRWLQLHLTAPGAKNALNLTAYSLQKLHQSYPETNVSAPGYGYTYGAWIRRNYTGADSNQYTLIHEGSNLVNYAVALVDTLADATWMAFTNVGGADGAGVAVEETVLSIRNGTIILA